MTERPRIGVMICARDEEKNISLVLDSLQRQTHRVNAIVVIDDESSDATGVVASRHEAHPTVLRIEGRRRTRMMDRDFAEIRNLAYSRLKQICGGMRFFLVLDADLTPPENYVEVLSRSLSDGGVVVASGRIDGESSNEPRAGCRLVRVNFFEEIGGAFPSKIGCETYIVLKALQLGYRCRIHNSLVVVPLRKTTSKVGGPTGWAMRAQGYHWLRVLLVLLNNARESPMKSLKDFVAFVNLPQDQLYQDEFRKFMRNWSRPRILRQIRPVRGP